MTTGFQRNLMLFPLRRLIPSRAARPDLLQDTPLLGVYISTPSGVKSSDLELLKWVDRSWDVSTEALLPYLMWVTLCKAGSSDTLGIWSRRAVTNRVWSNGNRCGVDRSGVGVVPLHRLERNIIASRSASF